jgi:dTDP-4-dehydrorhamnose 3,5-epimerase
VLYVLLTVNITPQKPNAPNRCVNLVFFSPCLHQLPLAPDTAHMEIKPTSLPDVMLVAPRIIRDPRGYFAETFRMDALTALGMSCMFLQENQSMSAQGVLRGLHFQSPPHAQAKLVRVIRGSVLDVAVDIRKESPTYLKHVKVVLNAQDLQQLYIPEGFAHGFLTLEPDTVFAYKCSTYYHRESEGGLAWDDPQLGIDWGIETPTVSEKDSHQPSVKDFKSPF